ncbi:MAG: YitT family protein [Ruminococcaceae bacterium]|nr:YitT family protein [Oscillospiraceae bacterium]MBQ3215006.1 YitT family protein [Oscillospiraceae bacterium]
MKKFKQRFGWIFLAVLGCAIFALGFDLFLIPNEMNTGGVSGLSMVIRELLGFGSVGLLQILINIPLFLLGGMKIGKKFFWGSLLGMSCSSVFIDVFSRLPVPPTEPLLGALYGGLLCGFGAGLVFSSGASTGGSDILVRLLKLRYRNVPVGQICLCIDAVVAVLTGLVFRDATKALYTGITVFVTSRVVDAVIYRFDYSKVVLIITGEYERVAREIGQKLRKGTTFLYGQGAYSGKETKVVLTAVKRQQLAELKELVTEIDPEAFIIVQEAHQVLGDGFARYSKNEL